MACQAFPPRNPQPRGCSKLIGAVAFVVVGALLSGESVRAVENQETQLISGCGCDQPAESTILASAQRTSEIISTVIGGVVATPTQFPNIGKVRISSSAVSGQLLCTGTLITPQWVLTAAHCVTNQSTGALLPDLAVTVEFNDSIQRPADLVIPHPTYVGFVSNPITGSVVGDICLIRLQTATSGIAPAEIQTSAPFVGQNVTLVGFGNTGTPFFGQASGTAGVKRFGTQRIDQVTVEQTRWRFNFPETQSTAQGDSGGPQLSASEAVVSVTSGLSRTSFFTPIAAWRTTCFNTRADKYFAWIQTTIQENSPTTASSKNPTKNLRAEMLLALKSNPFLSLLLARVPVTQAVE